MDRVIIYPGAIPLETDLLATNKNALIGLSKLAAALFGTSTLVNGFAVTPTGPASLQVVVAPGEIYSLQNIDGTAYSSIAADTSHSILKQGIALESATLNCPAPTTTGQSINYLVQAAYQDVDAIPTVLPYYNASNPSQAYSGPANNGVAQNTRRNGVAVVSVKTGVSAATGSQPTPAPDVGYVGLYVITVAFAQTAITTGNITPLPTRPQINSSLHGSAPVFTVSPVVPIATLPGQAVQLSQVAAVVGQSRNVAMYVPTASASATITADEIIVQTAIGGVSFCLSGFSSVINLGTTGAGGMNSGVAPVSGYVSIYAIYNPTTNTSALLAFDTTTILAPEIAPTMPSGYTASALVAVIQTTAARLIYPCAVLSRKVYFTFQSAVSSVGTVPSVTAVNISAIVPKNAKSVSGYAAVGSTSATNAAITISATAQGVASKQIAGSPPTGSAIYSSPFSDLPLPIQQTMYWQVTIATGTLNSAQVNISGFEF